MASKKKKAATFDPIRAARELVPGVVRPYPGAGARSIQTMGKAGLRSLRDARAQLSARLVDWSDEPLTRFAALLDAFTDAAVAVESSEPIGNPELAKDTERGFALRRLLLASANTAALAGQIPSDEYERIARGKGRVDAAQDLKALVALHRAHAAALKNKTFVTEAMLDEAMAIGARLLGALKPKTAKLTPSELGKARDLRDRLYTLLQLAHDELWHFAAFIYGRQHLDEAFPALLSRTSAPAAPKPAPKKPEKKAEAEPAPEAPPKG